MDFSNFCWQAFPEKRELCLNSFKWLIGEQDEFSAANDPSIDILDDWYLLKSKLYSNGDGRTKQIKTKTLYEEMHIIAREKGIRFFISVQKFGHWISSRQPILEKKFGYEKQKNSHTKNYEHSFKVYSEEEHEENF